MTFELPEPISGQTHIKLYRMTENLGAWVTARGYLGTLEDGDFVKEESLRDVEIDLMQDDYQALQDRAKGRGAPSGEFRKADLVDHAFDANTEADFNWI